MGNLGTPAGLGYGGCDADKLSAQLPVPAASAPPAVGVSGATGTTNAQYARSDHTHATSVQRKTLTTAINAGSSTATWTFATPYDTLPVVIAIPQAASATSAPYIVQVLNFTIVNGKYTGVTFIVSQLQSTALSTGIIALGVTVTPFVAAPANITLNCLAGLPTQ